VVAIASDSHRIEVGIFGREGMSGTSLLMDVETNPHQTFTQIPGPALRLPTDSFREAIGQSGFTRRLWHGGPSRSLAAHVPRPDGRQRHTPDPRVPGHHAGRAPGRRDTHILEGVRAIKAQRGLITVLDRDKLEEAAGENYGAPKAEYERVIGPFRRVFR
jgi:hypothetical protein